MDGMLAPLHPDVRFEPLRAVLEGTVYCGHAGFRRWLEDMADDWQDFEIELSGMRELEGERVLVEATVHARAKGSGVELHAPGAWLCDFSEGKLAYLRFYSEAEAALEDAGEGKEGRTGGRMGGRR
jgi:hypothetical protein